MLTSAPFDDWWHNAFGLDVQIMSPPHVVLIMGIFALGLGGLFLIVAEMNRASEDQRAKLNRLFLYAGCMLTILLLMLIYEYTDYTLSHSAVYYRALALAMPPVLVGIARASGSLGGHQSSGDLLRPLSTRFVACAFRAGRAEAGSGVHEDLAPRAPGVSMAAFCGSRAGLLARSPRNPQQMAASDCRRNRIRSHDDGLPRQSGNGCAGRRLRPAHVAHAKDDRRDSHRADDAAGPEPDRHRRGCRAREPT
jgi:hypothetical protein